MSSSRVLNSLPFWQLGVILPVTHSIRVLFGCRCWVTMTLLHLPCTHPLSADFLYRPIRGSKPLRSVYCWKPSQCTFLTFYTQVLLLSSQRSYPYSPRSLPYLLHPGWGKNRKQTKRRHFQTKEKARNSIPGFSPAFNLKRRGILSFA